MKLDLHAWMPPTADLEPSGLCVLPGGRELLVVCDEGRLARVALDDPTRVRVTEVRPATDLEGVALTEDGRLLVLAEKKDEVWEVQDGARSGRWKIRPRGGKKSGYEGLAVVPGAIVLSQQGTKRSALRTFAIPSDGIDTLERQAEQTLDWPDVAGLTWWSGRLLALSDRGHALIALRWDGGRWEVLESWETPAEDLEGLAVAGDWLYFAQDSGGLLRTPWPPER